MTAGYRICWKLPPVRQCLPNVPRFPKVESWQYPGRWTHVPSRQVTVGSGENRGEPEILWESVAFLKEWVGFFRIPGSGSYRITS